MPSVLKGAPAVGGHRRTLGNFVKATFAALAASYGFLTPDLWQETAFSKPPNQEFTDVLSKPYKPEEPKMAY